MDECIVLIKAMYENASKRVKEAFNVRVGVHQGSRGVFRGPWPPLWKKKIFRQEKIEKYGLALALCND